MFKLSLEKAAESKIKLPHPLDHRKSKRIPEKYLLSLHWLRLSLWLCNKLWKILKSHQAIKKKKNLKDKKRRNTEFSGLSCTFWIRISRWFTCSFNFEKYLCIKQNDYHCPTPFLMRNCNCLNLHSLCKLEQQDIICPWIFFLLRDRG